MKGFKAIEAEQLGVGGVCLCVSGPGLACGWMKSIPVALDVQRLS